MRRGLLSTVGMLLLTLICARYASFEPTNPSMNGESLATKAPSPAGTFKVIHVSTDESILQRMRPEASPIVMRINDRELLQTLVQIGRPAGLIRIGDRLALSAPVTDDELTSSVRNH